MQEDTVLWKMVQMLKNYKSFTYVTSYCIVWEDLWRKLKFFSAMKSWDNKFLVKPLLHKQQKNEPKMATSEVNISYGYRWNSILSYMWI